MSTSKRESTAQQKDPRPFPKIKEAARRSGLSEFFIRRGCKDGSIPCIRSGATYLVDYDGMIDRLREQARTGKEEY